AEETAGRRVVSLVRFRSAGPAPLYFKGKDGESRSKGRRIGTARAVNCRIRAADPAAATARATVMERLYLVVMRLTRPSFVTETPLVTFDPRDLFAQSAPALSPQKCAANQRDIAEGAGHQKINLTDMLSLPQNFGNIYLGETFSAYVSTNSSKVAMTAGSAEPVSELPPDRSIDEVLTHEVKELGPHILVCTVSYTSHSSEKLYFKKYFKFQVQRPLDVKTDFRTTENDEVFLEAKIQNITSGPIFLERVFLEPSPNFQLLDTPSTDREDDSGVRVPECLREQETRQFPVPPPPAPLLATRSRQQPSVGGASVTVGKLDITWRSQMGQRARLQTSPLCTALPPAEDIRVTVEEAPAWSASTPCSVSSCRQSLEQSQAAMQFCGKVARSPTRAALRRERQPEPGAAAALVPGLQSVSGLVLTEPRCSSRSYEFDELTQVLVH
uniref:TPPC8 protein n=1 Tax=Macrostomum lignano TaxID=282301 RepID=A0A1I8FL75_9PLAT